ncbi:GNAT family N-acetyltransferase [Tahibacter amnicola]|uniref:GNAT family N-acetyltransferase n=1 Tax=Tahibacter amnicola TaxID=2976241 RepID=A0ABY6B886_9GAMM|nr:GNAT family N-acetyltransferase [Tahibacter amnicola]UXI66229.1 GNAT family N-acetyltransferase [Tahibacter amnicola]
MLQFPEPVKQYWQQLFCAGETLFQDEHFLLSVNPALREERRLMVLTLADGRVLATTTPAMAEVLHLARRRPTSMAGLRERLEAVGGALHGADHLFYYDRAAQAELTANPADAVRRLSGADEPAFRAFEGRASEQDRDDASVALEHWIACGAFVNDHLVCVASLYPWGDAPMGDMGVLTLAEFRGLGHARRVVRAISGAALEQGYEPQYRCQLDNLPSVALAKSAGLSRFGSWDVISPDSPV